MQGNSQFEKVLALCPLLLGSLLAVLFFSAENFIAAGAIRDVYLPVIAIAVLGISHGSLDHVVYRKRLKPKNILGIKFGFTTLYVLLLLAVVILWQLEPILALLAFLTMSILHFGADDSEGAAKNRMLEAYVRGMIPIIVPAFRYPEEVSRLFRQLIGNNSSTLVTADNVYLYSVAPMLVLIIALFLWFKMFDYKNSLVSGLEIILVASVFWTMSPLTAFCVYFCGIHATRKVISIAGLLSQNDLGRGVLMFHRLSLRPTGLVLLVSGVVYVFLSRYIPMDEAAVRVTFIALNALTLPHILLPFVASLEESQTIGLSAGSSISRT